MTFNFLTPKRVFFAGQYDRIDDFVAFNLSGDERPLVRKFLVGEFHSSALSKRFNPRVAWHSEFLRVARPLVLLDPSLGQKNAFHYSGHSVAGDFAVDAFDGSFFAAGHAAPPTEEYYT
jgi:hypothetical protein